MHIEEKVKKLSEVTHVQCLNCLSIYKLEELRRTSNLRLSCPDCDNNFQFYNSVARVVEISWIRWSDVSENYKQFSFKRKSWKTILTESLKHLI